MESQSKTEQTNPIVNATSKPITLSKYSNRVELKTLLQNGGAEFSGDKIVIGGWVKSSRTVRKDSPPPPPRPHGVEQTSGPSSVSCVEIIQSRITMFKKIINVLSGGGGGSGYSSPMAQKPAPPPVYTFHLVISDGSCVAGFQVVADSSLFPIVANKAKPLPIGTCIVVEGILRKPSSGGVKYMIELQANKILHMGAVEQDKYPLAKKQLPLHTLREYSHFRPRTTTVASVTRIQSGLTFAAHTFFQHHGFQHVQVPIITTTDTEGSSEMFLVTTGLAKERKEVKEPKPSADNERVSLDVIKAAIKEKTNLVQELKRNESNREALVAALNDLKKTNDLASHIEAQHKLKSKASKVINQEDYFPRQTYLTVSGRLHLESYACALGNVYSFGPRFRANKIDNARHLAEEWSVETELAFLELGDAMNCADDFFKFLCKYILENRTEDMNFISKRIDKSLDRLEALSLNSIKRISYSETVALLRKVTDKAFEIKPEWGAVLTTEHLSYLADEVYNGPVIIYNYPKSIKPFYTRLNDDDTVAAFDIVVPKVGTLISGSQSEERFDKLNERIQEFGLPKEQYEWYLDLRRNGTVKHSGFSVQFDLLVLYVTGLPDVRDAVSFPRTWGKVNN